MSIHMVLHAEWYVMTKGKDMTCSASPHPECDMEHGMLEPYYIGIAGDVVSTMMIVAS